MGVQIHRLRGVLSRYGRSRSSVYSDIKDQLWPPPIALGARCSGWFEHECDTVVAARAAGLDNEAIRGLVARLVAARAAGLDNEAIRGLVARLVAARAAGLDNEAIRGLVAREIERLRGLVRERE